MLGLRGVGWASIDPDQPLYLILPKMAPFRLVGPCSLVTVQIEYASSLAFPRVEIVSIF